MSVEVHFEVRGPHGLRLCGTIGDSYELYRGGHVECGLDHFVPSKVSR
jgi:hypothetical protein